MITDIRLYQGQTHDYTVRQLNKVIRENGYIYLHHTDSDTYTEPVRLIHFRACKSVIQGQALSTGLWINI